MNKLSVLNCGSLYLILTPNTRHHLTRLSDCRYLVTPKTITFGGWILGINHSGCIYGSKYLHSQLQSAENVLAVVCCCYNSGLLLIIL